MKKIKAILFGAGSRGMDAYGPYALKHPDRLSFVAVAEPIKERREKFAELHDIEEVMCFSDYKEVFKQSIDADVVLVCTQDKMHLDPTLKALEHGYHVLLEKPIVSIDEALSIAASAKKHNRDLSICHVLRYTPFFRQIKALMHQGAIGELMSISHVENVGYWHAAHSFVRGNWRNQEEACPMILAKSCHDIDILMWLVESSCKSVASFGSLKHFRQEKAPKGATKRCLDCPVASSCPYDAKRLYLDDLDNQGWPVSVITEDLSYEGRKKALEEGPYGRCVYDCDNDVVDHQGVLLEFDNDVTVAFHMNSCTYETSREIKISGSKGEIYGYMEGNRIEVFDYLTNSKQTIDVEVDNLTEFGHGGGDYKLMEALVEHLGKEDSGEMESGISSAIDSHIVTYAAEAARIRGQVVDIVDFKREKEGV